MDKEEFLNTKLTNCKKCGNNIRPIYVTEHDMGATYECPDIRCHFCNSSAGVFYPGDEQKCIRSWEDKQRRQ